MANDKKDNKDKKDPENKKPKEDKKPKTVAEQAAANQKKAKAQLSGGTIGVGLKAKKMTKYEFQIPSDMEIGGRVRLKVSKKGNTVDVQVDCKKV